MKGGTGVVETETQMTWLERGAEDRARFRLAWDREVNADSFLFFGPPLRARWI